MKYTELYSFKISINQKKTLQSLNKKYKVNVSQFIREAIKEKIERDGENIFRKYKEIQKYIQKENTCPF